MDIQMPLLDGYHATKQIREELKSNVPIIAMTANIMANEREKCLSYGMNDYLSKPFKEIDLYNIINLHIGNKKQSQIQTTELKAPENDNIINQEHLNTLSRGNKTFIKEIVDIFVEQNPIEIRELEDAIINKNYSSIRSISHKMKTSVGFIGINQLLPELTNIENLAINEGDLNNIRSIFNNVKVICQKAIIELKRIV
jgi:CheY-like chemotaxis protein